MKYLESEIKLLYGEKKVVFTKNRLGVPIAKTSCTTNKLDVSFSHHGNYSAYSYIRG